ncbi:hypothetical protein D3C84_1030740 [compost metagenome]
MLIESFEAGLPKENIDLALRRPFNHSFRDDALGRHAGLNRINIESSRCQMVDMWALECDHISNEAMLLLKFVEGF